MFNVLLVDDDQVVLECMSKFVDWTEMGFKVAGAALSAVQAVNIMENEYVDVLLTDIVMPRRDGLELIHDAREINPYVKTVILSSHCDFNYAKEAIRLGSFDYLTKPVNYGELKNIFKKLNSVLINEREEKKKQTEIQHTLEVQFLNNLVNGFFHSMEQINKKAFEIGFELTDGNFCLIRLLIDELYYVNRAEYENEYAKTKSEISGRAYENLKRFGKVCIFENNAKEIAILFYPADTGEPESVIENLADVVGRGGKADFSIGVGSCYHSLVHAPDSFLEAGKALEYRFAKRERCLYYKKISEFFRGRSVITPDIEEKIQEYLVSGDRKKFEEYVFGILSGLYGMDKGNKGILYDACIEILLIINKVLSNYVNNGENLKQNDYTAIRTLLKKNDYEEIKAFFSEFLEESLSVVAANREKPKGIAIESVIKYINEHYSENITLQKLSEIAYLHPIYLCKLFKEKTGQNFMDYLMRVRIEKAMKLLGNLSLRIYDVCEMVGYDSPQHFSKVFKEVAGITPKDYRKKCHV